MLKSPRKISLTAKYARGQEEHAKKKDSEEVNSRMAKEFGQHAENAHAKENTGKKIVQLFKITDPRQVGTRRKPPITQIT